MEARPSPEIEQTYRADQNGNYRLYEGLREIAQVMGKGQTTVWRYIHRHHLPAAKFPGGTWCISNNLIDAWLVARHQAIMEQKRTRKSSPRYPLIDDERAAAG